MSSKWRDVGDLLGVHSRRLEVIHKNVGGDLYQSCQEVLLEWL